MSTKFSKVEGYDGLIRDNNTNAVLNTNMIEYQNYKNLRKSKEAGEKKLQSLEDDLNQVKNDLDEIKNLLRTLANGS